MPSYKLTYFNGRGRGEIARMLLAASGKKFEDVRIEFSDWPALKASKSFIAATTTLSLCIARSPHGLYRQ